MSNSDMKSQCVVVLLLIGHFLTATIAIQQLTNPELRPQWICSTTKLCIKDKGESMPGNATRRYETQYECRLSCGRYGAIWPMPTGECSLGHRRIRFDPLKIRFNVDTASAASKQFILETHRIFVKNIITECLTNCSVAQSKNVLIKATVSSSDLTLDWSTDESYQLSIQTKGPESVVNINAPTVYGARHAFETLSNLITGCKENGLTMVSAARITDRPKFPHRGVLLDTARNFMPLQVIRNTLDAMAASKLNVFHWHAVDTHSFPLEIRRVPEMQQFGAYSASNTYSRSETLNLIKYARQRGIRVIIEIDGPSHAGNGWQWGPLAGMDTMSVNINRHPWQPYCDQPPCGQLNPLNPNMYATMKKIYEDLAEIGSPEETIHMGGDEVRSYSWYSNQDIADEISGQEDGYLGLWWKFHEKNLKSWDDVNQRQYPHQKLPKPVIVWSSQLTHPQHIEKYLPKERFIIQTSESAESLLNPRLIQMGYRLIISTNDVWYLDDGLSQYTLYRNWSTVYNNKMTTTSPLILGGEVCMWSEYVDENSVESRIWPRAGAAAERLWSDPITSSLHAQQRFYRYRERLKSRGINAKPLTSRWCVLNEGQCY